MIEMTSWAFVVAGGVCVAGVMVIIWLWRRRAQAMTRLSHVNRQHDFAAERSASSSRRYGWTPTRYQFAGMVGLTGVLTTVLANMVAGVLVAVYTGVAVRAITRTRQERYRSRVLQWCTDAFACLAEDVRAGCAGDVALAALATKMRSRTGEPAWDGVLVALRRYRGVIPALRQIPEPLTAPCAQLAAAWQLLDAGIPLADVVTRLDREIETWRQRGAQLAGETASATATATVLAVLPFAGVAMGFMLGADPLHVLLHTPIGAVCACGGAGLQIAGWAWARRIADPRRLDATRVSKASEQWA